MKIDFVANPRFKPAPPELKAKVGSVVQTVDGYKRFIQSIDYNAQTTLYSIYRHDWHTEDYFKVLPERVCGWDEKGPMFEPMAKPVPLFTWADYPPRAGMVVETIGARLLAWMLPCIDDGFWRVLDVLGSQTSRESGSSFRMCYLPRPDLMPRFVEDE